MEHAYELTVVLTAEAAGKDKEEKLVEAVIGRIGGSILNVDEWGEKTLSYPIKGYDSGVYILYTVNMTPEQAEELKKRLQLEKGLLRWLLIKEEKHKIEAAQEE